MPKRTDIQSILIIGAGPIVIGQACEFDYSGTQACKALKAEGYRIVLVNSNPATIMTDPELADATYVEPFTQEIVDFKSGAAYSQYKWELFYFAPLLVAMRLSTNQKFEDAMRWFHYIFDPTGGHDKDPQTHATAPAPQNTSALRVAPTRARRRAPTSRGRRNNSPRASRKRATCARA